MAFLLQHTILWWCWWDIAAFLILCGVIVMYIVKIRRMKKDQEILEKAADECAAQIAASSGQPG